MPTEEINIILNALEHHKHNYDVIGVAYENDKYVALVQAIESLENLRRLSYVPKPGNMLIK